MTRCRAEAARTRQVYRVFIKASAQAIWDAITRPEWVAEVRLWRARPNYDLTPGRHAIAHHRQRRDEGAWALPDVMIVGEVIEADPPRKLVQTWHPVWDPAPPRNSTRA